MAIKKNLGGDRLGSGAKNDVYLSGYNRSTHNLSETIRTTQAVGTLVPIYKQFLQKGDSVDIDLDAMGLTRPTEGPLLGTFKLQMDVFTAPIRLYQGKLHMNLLDQGLNMEDIKFPQVEMEAQGQINWEEDGYNFAQINETCIFNYLGIKGLGKKATAGAGTVKRLFNSSVWNMYWDIYGNYYANQQEKIGAVIHNVIKNPDYMQITYSEINDGGIESLSWQLPAILESGFEVRIQVYTDNGEVTQDGIELLVARTTQGSKALLHTLFEDVEVVHMENGITQLDFRGPGTEVLPLTIESIYQLSTGEESESIEVSTFPLTNLNEMKMDILASVRSAEPFIIKKDSIAPFGLALQKGVNKYLKESTMEGLGLKTYQSDLYNNWLNANDINSINSRSAVQVTDGKFTIDSFLMMEKLYNYLNRIVLAGNTVDDWEEVTWGEKRHKKPEIPIYEGGLSKELVFEQVISNSATEEQPLGTMAGRGTLGSKHKGGKVRIKVDEASYVIVIASLTPRLDYYQGNDWDMNLKTFEDIHKPEFDRIAFQNLITDQMAWWDTNVTDTGVTTFKSAGKQPSWMNYQTSVNKVYGNFANKQKEGWMVLTRDYEADEKGNIKDLTTYIDPGKWNDVFAYKAREAQNFWMQYSVKATMRRIMSANQIPGL